MLKKKCLRLHVRKELVALKEMPKDNPDMTYVMNQTLIAVQEAMRDVLLQQYLAAELEKGDD